MASKERIQRLKDENRTKILDAALRIVKEEGWQALSLRKIAEVIEYTAPIIYEYFTNKEAILLELARQGYSQLYKRIKEAKSKHRLPATQLEAMWMAYWNFAFAEKEFYQIMYGVEVNCCAVHHGVEEGEWPGDLFDEVIRELTKHKKPTEDDLCRWYYTYWSVVHGLISINIVRIGTTDEINKQILKSAISGLTRSISD